MIETPATKTPTDNFALSSNGPSRDTVHYLCRVLTTLAWIAIFLWILAPKGSCWGSAAGDAGLAWIFFTGGGCFAEQTLRSFVDLWREFLTSINENTTYTNKEHSPR